MAVVAPPPAVAVKVVSDVWLSVCVCFDVFLVRMPVVG
jgi:hypothetical protein